MTADLMSGVLRLLLRELSECLEREVLEDLAREMLEDLAECLQIGEDSSSPSPVELRGWSA